MGMYDCPVQGDPPPWEYEYRVLVAADRRRTYSPKVLYSSHARQEGARETLQEGRKKAASCRVRIRYTRRFQRRERVDHAPQGGGKSRKSSEGKGY